MTKNKNKLEKLSEEEKEKLCDLLMSNLYDRHWCNMKGINYSDPDIQKIREETYKEFWEIYKK